MDQPYQGTGPLSVGSSVAICGVAGSSIGQKIGDVAKGLGGKLTQKAADTAWDVGKGISDGAKVVGEFFGGVLK